MSDAMRSLCDSVQALTTGWREHVEYGVTVTTPMGYSAIEKRAKSVQYPGLLVQLQLSTSMPSSGAGGGGTSPNKAGSKPPGNVSYLMLADSITIEARTMYAAMYTVNYYKLPVMPKGPSLVLHAITEVAARMQDEYPEVVREAAYSARTWVGKARTMLGYQTRQVMLASTVCGTCGGGLSVAVDATTDVRCVGNAEMSGCGQVYRRDQWLSLL